VDNSFVVVAGGTLHGALGYLVTEFARYGVVIVGLVVAGESFGSPLPGELGLFLGAFEIERGNLSLGAALAVAVAGAICADNLAYLLGRRAGRPLIGRLMALLHLRLLERLERHFARHAAITVSVARWISPLRGITALTAGATQLSWRRFVLYNAVGAISWSVTLLAIALLLAAHLEGLANLVGDEGLLAVAGLVAGFVLLLGWLHLRRVRHSRSGQEAQRAPRSPSGTIQSCDDAPAENWTHALMNQSEQSCPDVASQVSCTAAISGDGAHGAQDQRAVA
jgi:membrane protein DedA with SNARE-associated domain